MVVTVYDVVLNNFGDVKNVLRDIFLRTGTESYSSGVPTEAVEFSFWVNMAQSLLQDYEFKWLVKSGTLTPTSGISSVQLSVRARAIKPLKLIYNATNNLIEIPTLEEYNKETFNRTGTGTPRRYCYIEDYTTNRNYTTGLVTATLAAHLITGAGTSWLDNLDCGSIITIGANSYTVVRVNSDTEVTVKEAIVMAVAGSAYSVITSSPLPQIDLDPIPSSAAVHTIKYYQKLIPLVNDSDALQLPLNDRWVLPHGAYSLWKWFHDDIGKTGISPMTSVAAVKLFLNSPTTAQKFYDQFVSKMLANQDKLIGAAKPKLKYKRGY